LGFRPAHSREQAAVKNPADLSLTLWQ
jgi:hypothetical protein